jgi:ribosomal protein S27AE
MTQAFCLREKKTVPIKNEEVVTTANGLKRAKGVCPTCGVGVSKILGK